MPTIKDHIIKLRSEGMDGVVQYGSGERDESQTRPKSSSSTPLALHGEWDLLKGECSVGVLFPGLPNALRECSVDHFFDVGPDTARWGSRWMEQRICENSQGVLTECYSIVNGSSSRILVFVVLFSCRSQGRLWISPPRESDITTFFLSPFRHSGLVPASCSSQRNRIAI